MTVREVYEGSNGQATAKLYERLKAKGGIGEIALNIFRAQKASERAKLYSRSWKGPAYEKKNWSIALMIDALRMNPNSIKWGWKRDPNPPPGFPWIVYIDLPTGQASFHAATRGSGPDYQGEWDNGDTSANRIIRFVAQVLGEEEAPAPINGIKITIKAVEEVNTVEEDYFDKLAAWKRKHGIIK